MNLIDKYLGEGKGEFIHFYKDSDGWAIVHSIHNVPTMGGQRIETLKDEKEARKLAEKLAKKWNATLAKWNKKGTGAFARFTSA